MFGFVQEDAIKREIAAEVTFEELQRARSDGSDLVFRKPKTEKKGGRANKNRFVFLQFDCALCCWEALSHCLFGYLYRPMEISSKKPVSRFREVIQAPKKVGILCFFSNLSTDIGGEKGECIMCTTLAHIFKCFNE